MRAGASRGLKLKRRTAMNDHAVATREEWFQTRMALLNEEKEFTRARAALSARRRALLWVKSISRIASRATMDR